MQDGVDGENVSNTNSNPSSSLIPFLKKEKLSEFFI
jgi:hypothetical protein